METRLGDPPTIKLNLYSLDCSVPAMSSPGVISEHERLMAPMLKVKPLERVENAGLATC